MLTDTEPPECQHCKQYGFDCTFFLPITETRFRKQRMEAMKAEEEEKADKEKETRTTKSPSAEASRGADVRVFGERCIPDRLCRRVC